MASVASESVILESAGPGAQHVEPNPTLPGIAGAEIHDNSWPPRPGSAMLRSISHGCLMDLYSTCHHKP